MSRITVVGSINIDLAASVSRMPLEGETIPGRSFASLPGGKGANQAVCAARLGGDVQMIGRLGDDIFASQLRRQMDQAGVDTRGILQVPGPTGTAVITVADSGANSIVVIPGANAALSPEALDGHMDALRTSSLIMTQLETPLATSERLGDIARELRIPFMLDPAPAQDLPPGLLRNVTWLTPNESETQALLEHLGAPMQQAPLDGQSLKQAAEHLLTSGVQNVVLKLGARGVFMMGALVPPTFIPAHVVEAVDTVAAGDAFNGGFAFALMAKRMAPTEAARFACAVSAVSVTRAGAQPSMPTYPEAEAMLGKVQATPAHSAEW